MNFFYFLCKRIITIYSFIFAILIAMNSLIITIDYDYNEFNWKWSTSKSIQVILSIFLFLVLILFFRKWLDISSKKISNKILLRYTFFLSLALGIGWVISADALQQWDQGDILNLSRIKTQLDIGNVGGYDHAGYIERYPYQAPFIYLFRLLILISGTRADYIYSLLNALFVAITMRSLVALTIEYDKNNHKTPIIAFILSISLLPSYFFTTFIYPNTLSIMLISIAFLYFMKWYKTGNNTQIIKYGIYSSIAIGAAVAFKSSSIVGLISFIVVNILIIIKEKKIIPIAFILISIATNWIILNGSMYHLSKISNANLNNGVPKIIWIAMGIGANQPSDKPIVLDFPGGMYDGLPWTLSPEEYSPDNLKKLAYKLIEKRVMRFKDQPKETLYFFVKKCSYEWGDPLYGAILSSNWQRGNVFTLSEQKVIDLSQGDRPITPVAHSIYYGQLNSFIKWLSDINQSLIFIGFLLGVILISHKNYSDRWLEFMPPILYSLVGSLVYIFWESKSQYIFGFVTLLIPIASYGFQNINLSNFLEKKNKL
ncbi:hypothetical protein QV01_02240 [Gallibacterium genomosp. 3]|uniref:Glycosyltransferase RgtA/B/C/D-like domain-containing protein n=1 Tax=Gallibacterium genomosp. 3 TaxID=505345 RepID=A0A1A7NVC2_9PAST|nr:hypothetical protein [Gallibacterium genomosp. 3]OBW93446.1 hypothetical protein QV01_02240 [Gallibacterium genomosp. 3]